MIKISCQIIFAQDRYSYIIYKPAILTDAY